MQDTEENYAEYMLKDAGFPDLGHRSLMKDAGQHANAGFMMQVSNPGCRIEYTVCIHKMKDRIQDA